MQNGQMKIIAIKKKRKEIATLGKNIKLDIALLKSIPFQHKEEKKNENNH
jgi:hypothetical protein